MFHYQRARNNENSERESDITYSTTDLNYLGEERERERVNQQSASS
jgi:hypothetical protein